MVRLPHSRGREAEPLVFDTPVLLLGGGPVSPDLLAELRPLCGAVVAADGGADRLREGPLRPDAIIGDMDSIADLEAWQAMPGVEVVHVTEQETTDLEKCLRLTRAPLYLAAGFLGGRLDHTLAALHALLLHPDRRLLLVGEEDVAFLAPRRWRARLEAGARVSLHPLAPCVGLASHGLAWPLKSLDLEIGRAIGTSNRAERAEVGVDLDRRAAVLMLERRFLPEAIESLRIGPD
ncbi:MAG: thiamine diphosphokinase [Pseudomonadota bacterium]